MVKSYIKYFAVPKGDDDICLVYDAMGNKLNKSIDLLIWAVDKGSWMTDRDVGNIFLNCQLHEDVRPFIAMDLSCLYIQKRVGPGGWCGTAT
jgi:hypothetical protein